MFSTFYKTDSGASKVYFVTYVNNNQKTPLNIHFEFEYIIAHVAQHKPILNSFKLDIAVIVMPHVHQSQQKLISH